MIWWSPGLPLTSWRGRIASGWPGRGRGPQPHTALHLALEEAQAVVDLYRRAGQPVGVRATVEVGASPGQSGGSEPGPDGLLGACSTHERFGIGEMAGADAQTIAYQLDRTVQLSGKFPWAGSRSSRAWLWVWDPMATSPVDTESARPAQLTGWPSPGKNLPVSTKSVDT